MLTFLVPRVRRLSKTSVGIENVHEQSSAEQTKRIVTPKNNNYLIFDPVILMPITVTIIALKRKFY
jgi:hypothetical protein